MTAHQIDDGDLSEVVAGRRERKKAATRQAIEDTARKLYANRGFDKTSVVDITEAIDVSERTFYRYFTSKEDVLFGPWRRDLKLAVQLIESRPPSESPLEAMRGALQAMASHFEDNTERYLFIAQLATSSEDVAAYQGAVIMPSLVEAGAQGLARRLGVEASSDLRPYLFAGVGAAAVNAAVKRWVASGGQHPLQDLLMDALDLLPSG
ncbi:MAG: TetR/AcrR family transcriptional regulator [Acidimicrobiia bacterium]|nr:TetR/AcrR family transcriptional regulator [Acidimicrobiia bacterium]